MSQLSVDSITGRVAGSAPSLPNGVVVTGVVTATSFSGDGSGLSGIGGSSLSAGGSVKVQATSTGADVTGNLGVSGDATVTGNLTVNGTTTTIDTAVTSVDSLAVDGDVGIGTTNPTSELSIFGLAPTIFLKDTLVGNSGVGSAYLRNDLTQSRFEIGINDYRCIHFNTGGDVVLSYGNSGKFVTTSAGVRVVGDLEVDDVGIFKGGLVEKFQTGTTLASDNTLALSDGNVVLRTSNESGNQTVNFTGVHSTLSTGQVVSFTVIMTPNGSGAINAVQIDAVAQTIQWSGGSAPSAGSSGKDIYTFTILKTGSGTTNYEVFGAATNYA